MYTLQLSIQFHLTLLHTADFHSSFPGVIFNGKSHPINQKKTADPRRKYLDALNWPVGRNWHAYDLHRMSVIKSSSDSEILDGPPDFLKLLRRINRTVVCSNYKFKHAQPCKQYMNHWKILKLDTNRIGILGLFPIKRIGRNGKVLGTHFHVLCCGIDMYDNVSVVHSGEMGKISRRIVLLLDDGPGDLANRTERLEEIDQNLKKDLLGQNVLVRLRKEVNTNLTGNSIQLQYKLMLKLFFLDIGKSRVPFESNCAWKECNLGNLVCDAFVDYRASQYDHKQYWTDAPIAIIHNAAILSDIPCNSAKDCPITTEQVSSALANNETIKILKISGKVLKEVLEFSVSDTSQSKYDRFLQVAGLHVVYDWSQPAGNKIQSLKARCGQCDVPKYEDVDEKADYTIIVPQTLAEGGLEYEMLRSITSVPIDDSLKLCEIVQRYIEFYKIVQTGVEERIRILNKPELMACAQLCIPITYWYIVIMFAILAEQTCKCVRSD